MAAPTSSSLPPGHNAPLAVLDPDDHGAWILICNAFGLTVVLITLLIRIYIRVKVSPPYGVDDWTVTGATAIATVQCGIVFSQVDTGYGKSIDLIDDGPLTKVQEVRKPSIDCWKIRSIDRGNNTDSV